MELVEGKSLQTMTSASGLPVESILRYGIQIASALSRAHDRGIIHRDLKGSNIVATPEGLVKVLDFGLAKRVGAGILDAPTMTFSTLQGASSVSGTLPYMAPEILRGEPVDARSDLWALGVVLYELASGHLPFEGGTGFEISSAILHENPKPLGPPVPPGFACACDGHLRVYRTRNAGTSWEALTRGLPQKQPYETVFSIQPGFTWARAADNSVPPPTTEKHGGQKNMAEDHGRPAFDHLRVLRPDRRWNGTIRGAESPACGSANKIGNPTSIPSWDEEITVPLLFHIPGALREFTEGRATVRIEHFGGTVHYALTALCAQYPGVRDRVLTEQGQGRQHVNIFVGNEDVRYTGGLATKVLDGSEISIVPAVSGGQESAHDGR